MPRKESKKKQEERINRILVLLAIILIILIVIVVATKTNKGRMKENRTVNSEVISLPEGIYYQDGNNEDVYFKVNSYSYENGKLNFDLKAGQLYESINALIENNTGIAELDSDNGTFKVKINIAEDVVRLLVTESKNDNFSVDEEYEFVR